MRTSCPEFELIEWILLELGYQKFWHGQSITSYDGSYVVFTASNKFARIFFSQKNYAEIDYCRNSSSRFKIQIIHRPTIYCSRTTEKSECDLADPIQYQAFKKKFEVLKCQDTLNSMTPTAADPPH